MTPLAPARPTPDKPRTPRGELPRALRDILDALIHAAAQGTTALCTRQALEHVTSTRDKRAVWQYIHRLRADHGYDIITVPCRDGDATTGGYVLDVASDAIQDQRQIGFTIC